MKKLYLIDGYGFVFRAYHSLPPLTRPDGVPIGCVYGFTNMLYKLISSHNADYIAVVLDSGKKNFRHDLYKDYKANRPSPPEDLLIQFPIIRDVVSAFNIKVIEENGLEADDLISIYTKKGLESGIEVIIISSDKDLMQLVTERSKLYDPMRNIEIDEEKVFEKLGVKPSQVADYLSLVGDSSDNIPGVAGIGSKTAIDLITKFGSLDAIYSNIEKIEKERQRKLIIEGKDRAFLSKSLCDLNRGYDYDCDIEELKARDIDNEEFAKFLRHQGFNSLLGKIEKIEAISLKHISNIEFKKIHDLSSLKKLEDDIIRHGSLSIYALDERVYLTYGDNNLEIECSNSQKSQDLLGSSKDLYSGDVYNALKEILEADYVKKILINSKDLYKKLSKLSISLSAFEDVALMSYSLETGRHSHDMDDLIKFHLEGEGDANSNTLYRIYTSLERKLIEERCIFIYKTIELPLVPVLANMEIKGIKISALSLKSLSSEFNTKLRAIESKIFKLAGREFLISSPKQLSEVLFVDMGIALNKKSKTGAFSTSAGVLHSLSEEGYEIADMVIEWRKFSKLINTYCDALPNSIDPVTKRVHTNFMMTATNTGRLSSRDPNLQNIPVKSDEGQEIRKAFIAEEGNVLISADYSQIELRLLAHVANIGPLKEAFIAKKDIHSITASQIFGIPLEQIDSNLRRRAKAINFGIIYGISSFGLAKMLDIPKHEAKNYIDNYFRQYPGIKLYMDETVKYARMHGYVKNLFSRRCYINSINDKNFAQRSFGERAAINAPLQSSSADIIKKAMIALPDIIKERMVSQIHDELLFEVEKDRAEEYSKVIKRVMEGVVNLDIPLEVGITISNSWGEKT